MAKAHRYEHVKQGFLFDQAGVLGLIGCDDLRSHAVA
jgi:hypothetical protein